MDYDDFTERDRGVESFKIPPHAIQAEQSVLGGLMLENERWDTVSEKISEVDFYRKDHRAIFNAILGLAERQVPFDVVTIAEALRRRNVLADVGGLGYLGELSQNTPGTANIMAYADIVRDKSILRQLISVGSEMSESVFNPEGRETSELLEIAEKSVFEISEHSQKGQSGFVDIKALLASSINKIDEMNERGGNGLTGVSTGYTDLDEKTSGLQKGDLIIVAGRPSMGKTTIAMNIAENVAMSSNMPVAIFSMEMPGDSLTMRMMSSLGRIDHHKIRTGSLVDDDWPRLTSAMTLLSNTKLFIDDSPGLTPGEVRSRARRLTREHGQLGLIVLDYLQLMQSPSSGESRVAQISDISRGLKTLAKELDVPVMALSQLNRNLEQRPSKRPLMSDLRESGSIEQDADVIMFVYRDEVYHPDVEENKGKAELIIGKQRNGPIGSVHLSFLGKYTRFDNAAHDPYGDDNHYE